MVHLFYPDGVYYGLVTMEYAMLYCREFPGWTWVDEHGNSFPLEEEKYWIDPDD